MFSEIKEEEINSRKTSWTFRAAIGPGFTLLSAVLNSFSGEFTALSSKAGIPGLQIIFFFRLAQFLTSLLVVSFFRPKLTLENRRQIGTMVLAVVVNNTASNLMYMSFVYASPSIAFGIIQGSLAFFTACIGFLFLRETLSLVDVCGILCSTIGTVLVGIGISQEVEVTAQLLVVSIVLPTAAALSRATDRVLIRSLVGPSHDVSGITVLFYSTSVGTVVNLILTYIFETPVWAMSTEAAGFVTGLSLARAFEKFLVYVVVLKLEKAGIAVAMRMVIVPLSILLDYVFLGRVPNVPQAVGLSLVLIGSGVVIGSTLWGRHKEEQHRELKRRLNLPISDGN